MTKLEVTGFQLVLQFEEVSYAKGGGAGSRESSRGGNEPLPRGIGKSDFLLHRHL